MIIYQLKWGYFHSFDPLKEGLLGWLFENKFDLYSIYLVTLFKSMFY
jgi:hypothetical protein